MAIARTTNGLITCRDIVNIYRYTLYILAFGHNNATWNRRR
ncbi:hypothetical protein COLO4_01344 [Corchorus olitorius]|uniref:Uncharacterized protein n=1 Tax=Corchorus olitorius TaxID=93759 RepID=A0A1R3L2M5_9ROSI|nr:hypothetical protein COLO4_01344 [Corchorus olitorius]